MYGVKQIVSSGLVALVLCGIAIPILCRQAERLGLIDEPGGRKQHHGRVPIVGGLSVYVSCIVSGILMGFDTSFFLPLMLGFPIVLSGLVDDRWSLSPAARLTIQILSALGMIYLGHLQIVQIGNIWGTGPVVLGGAVASIFTILCTVGVINSINMIDGVDGLSGSLIALSLLPLILFAVTSEDAASVALLGSLVSAIVAFLFYNSRLFRSRAMVFLGDAGSTFVGFVLVWHLIKYTQGDQAVLSPVSAGWILGLPLADTVAVMVRRVFDRKSPFAADRTHFHHRLLDAGLGVKNTVTVMLCVHFVFIMIGVLGNAFEGSDFAFFWAFVAVTVLHFLCSHRIINRLTLSGPTGENLIGQ